MERNLGMDFSFKLEFDQIGQIRTAWYDRKPIYGEPFGLAGMPGAEYG